MTCTIVDALRRMGSGTAVIEARALLRHVLGCDDSYLIAHGDQALTTAQEQAFETLAARRRSGEPVAYLTGRREFYGLEFKVTGAVLIPRPETERLVELVLERIPAQSTARVLDLGTGSGCVAIAIAQQRPRAWVVAIDAAAEAVALARENAARHGVRNLSIVHGDWFAPVPAERFDVIAANPPYVAAGDPHLAAGDLRFEPRPALVAGPEGIECIAAIVAAAPDHLKPGGWLLFEHGHDQGARARALLTAARFARRVSTWRDLAGIERVSGAQLDPSRG
ncbi:MAG: peptide chain release factor N(5)-glutamine methyltransferase [Betaproteobacteria bacterium]|nr:peptide chain release factor N(5)-glutamine methyltransferase [Betaproteobacteria bacterium]MDH3436328.1 peptide chain release factor N(5)-glutamine methyltransferase [Betaproteobacteria bacterium]